MSAHPDDPQTPEQVQAAAEAFRRDYAAVRDQIARAVVGQTAIVDGVLVCLFAGGHALLEGVPGIGKTLLIRSLSQAVHLDFSRIQFTPDLMPADIAGTPVVVEAEGEGGRVQREFRTRASRRSRARTAAATRSRAGSTTPTRPSTMAST